MCKVLYLNKSLCWLPVEDDDLIPYVKTNRQTHWNDQQDNGRVWSPWKPWKGAITKLKRILAGKGTNEKCSEGSSFWLTWWLRSPLWLWVKTYLEIEFKDCPWGRWLIWYIVLWSKDWKLNDSYCPWFLPRTVWSVIMVAGERLTMKHEAGEKITMKHKVQSLLALKSACGLHCCYLTTYCWVSGDQESVTGSL